MSKRNVKCHWCGVADTPKDEMEFEMVGKTKPVRKNFHKNCYPLYLKDKAFKQEEQKELDELTETIKKIYGAKEVPKQAFTLLQNLRNGEPVFGKKQQIGKRYKEGYKYSLIKETFDHCSDTIEYWNSVKSFEGFMGAFKYALTIVIDKIYFVEQRTIEREAKKKLAEKHLAEVKVEEQSFENSYKKKTSNTDITDFLDD